MKITLDSSNQKEVIFNSLFLDLITVISILKTYKFIITIDDELELIYRNGLFYQSGFDNDGFEILGTSYLEVNTLIELLAKSSSIKITVI